MKYTASSQHNLAISFLIQPTWQHFSLSVIRNSLFFRECLSKPKFFNSERLLSSASFCLLRIIFLNSSKLKFESFNADCCSSLSDGCLSDSVAFSSCGKLGKNSNSIFKVSASLVMEGGMISNLKKRGKRKNIHVKVHQENYKILHRHKGKHCLNRIQQ